jgi:hypothetical protein
MSYSVRVSNALIVPSPSSYDSPIVGLQEGLYFLKPKYSTWVLTSTDLEGTVRNSQNNSAVLCLTAQRLRTPFAPATTLNRTRHTRCSLMFFKCILWAPAGKLPRGANVVSIVRRRLYRRQEGQQLQLWSEAWDGAAPCKSAYLHL